jgi:NADH-quinone oxidoreductase subunit N
VAKYTVFVSAIESGWMWLVLIAILGSVVSIFYYFRPFINIWFKSCENESRIVVLPSLIVVVVIAVLLLIVVPVFANFFISYNL